MLIQRTTFLGQNNQKLNLRGIIIKIILIIIHNIIVEFTYKSILATWQ
jgi:hypothetical protein